MKKKLMKIYNFFHICKLGQLYSIESERNEFGVKIRQENEYYCKGFFCDKKIKIKII